MDSMAHLELSLILAAIGILCIVGSVMYYLLFGD